MNRMLVGGILAAGIVAAAATINTMAQDRTVFPGQPTQARIVIQNQGPTEAIPVSLEAVSADVQPLRVQLAGNSTVVLTPESVVRARPVAQPWEYETIRVPSGQDPAASLNAAGANGWEATGVALPTQGGTLVVMKRPR